MMNDDNGKASRRGAEDAEKGGQVAAPCLTRSREQVPDPPIEKKSRIDLTLHNMCCILTTDVGLRVQEQDLA